jgi:predicted enzyme related to lactoylglutathione lyase
MTWEDLRSPDPDAARAFYTAVFGFSTEHLDMAGPDHTTFAHPDEGAPLGGMGGMMGTPDAGPHWLVYFAVADTEASVAAAQQGGGTVFMPALDSSFGRMAGLLDPAGARFMVVQNTTNQPNPDREG